MTKLERLRYEQAQCELRAREIAREIEIEEESKPSIQCNVKISKKTYQALSALAKNNGLKKSEIVRQALDAYL